MTDNRVQIHGLCRNHVNIMKERISFRKVLIAYNIFKRSIHQIVILGDYNAVATTPVSLLC